MSSAIDDLVNSRQYQTYFILEGRSNFASSDTWTEIPFKTFTFEQTNANIVSSLQVQLLWDADILDTADTTQYIQMFSEIRLRQITTSLDIYTGTPVSDDRVIFQGFVREPNAKDVQLSITAYDPMIVLDKCIAHVGLIKSEIAVINDCPLMVEPGETDHYIIDSSETSGYIGDSPSAPNYDNRRTFKQIGVMYNDAYTPGELGYFVPASLITYGGSTRDFLRVDQTSDWWTDYVVTPSKAFEPHLTTVSVWKENTLFIEELLLQVFMMNVASGGPAWEEGIHFIAARVIVGVSTGSDYFEVRGDCSALFPATTQFIVEESTGNDGTYTSLGAAYSSATDITRISVAAVTDATVDGWLSLPNTTVFPSWVGVNQITWSFESGSLLALVQKVLDDTAPPNYCVWWDHTVGMLRAQYVEQYPGVYGSYTNDFAYMAPEYSLTGPNEAINITTTTVQIDTKHFASRVIVEGLNEEPSSVLANGTGANIYVPWVGGKPDNPWGSPDWTPLLTPPYTDPAGNPKRWLVDGLSTTDWGFDVNYHIAGGQYEVMWFDLCVIDAGAVYEFTKLRFHGRNSKRDFPFYIQVLCTETLPSEDAANYASGSWVPISDEFQDKKIGPLEVVDCDSFVNPMFRWIWIKMRAAKVGWTTLHGIGLAEIFGLAYGGKVFGEAYIGDVGSGVTGQYYDQGAMSLPMDGLRSLKHMPLMTEQLFGPSTDLTKKQSSHYSSYNKDHSLTTTDMCLERAKEILDELLRVHTHTSFSMIAHPEIQLFKSVRVLDTRKNFDDTYLVDAVKITPKGIEVSCVKYSEQTWLGEDII